jgi:hypothetical protein
MDEYIGQHRVRMLAIVVQVVPGQKIVWQLRKGVRLPVWLTFELAERDGGVDLRHTITAGFRGVGRGLDPLSGSTSPTSSPPPWTNTPGPSSHSYGTTSPKPVALLDHGRRCPQMIAGCRPD